MINHFGRLGIFGQNMNPKSGDFDEDEEEDDSDFLDDIDED